MVDVSKLTPAQRQQHDVMLLHHYHELCNTNEPSVIDVIDDKNVVTKIMSKYTGLQHIGFNGFAVSHWQTGYYPVAGGLWLGVC